jgi:hypothetical protein
MSVLDTIARAEKAGVIVRLDGGRLIAEADELPSAIIAELKAVRPGLMRLLRARQAAEAALMAERPEDCWMHRWAEAQRGLAGFVHNGWSDRCVLLGWTPEELFRLPALWSQVHLTGCAWLIGDRHVTAANCRPHRDRGVAGLAAQISQTGKGAHCMKYGEKDYWSRYRAIQDARRWSAWSRGAATGSDRRTPPP